ncbi:MAG: PAS domain S-box protein [Planctomycetes bacterium]|nr:PAS domain S-box protein [Planctomycetota bacterium]
MVSTNPRELHLIRPEELSELILRSELFCLRCCADGIVRDTTPATEAQLGPVVGRAWSEVIGSPFRLGLKPEHCTTPGSLALQFDHLDLPDGGRISLGRDLSEQERVRIRADEANRQLANQKTALDQHAIVATTDRKGLITYANEKFVEISGYSLDELLGQDHRLVNSGRHSEAFMSNLWSTISAGRVWRGEICNRAKNGELYWVNTTIVPFTDSEGEIVEYVAIRADITARKEHETELRLLASLVEASQDAIVREGLGGTVTAWNPGAERLYGATAGRTLGRPLSALFADAEQRTVASPEPVERVRKHADGSELLVAETVSPILDETGEAMAWVRISRDIGARRQLEARLAQAAKLAALGELAGNIAHEINNPIGVVSGKARLLLTREVLSPKVERELGKIVEQCDRIGRLTRGLLDYCRPTSSPSEPTDAQLHLHKAAAFVESRAQRHGVTIELDLLPDPPWISAQGSELQQVFLNLLLNGIDALSEDGGTIRIESRRGELRGHPALEFVITDDGPGVPAEHRGRVFEPFFTTREGKGTGLGLAICHALVHGQGGEIHLESPAEGGACFTLLFPTEPT